MEQSPARQPMMPSGTAPLNLWARHSWVAVLIGQGLLVFLMVGQRWSVWQGRVIGLPGDSSIYLWFLAWWSHAFVHGWPHAVTYLISYPYGNNVLWDTSVPLIFIPLSFLIHSHMLSLSLAYNLATFGGWWFSGFAAYLSYVIISRRRLASAIGSFVTLSSAYFTNQALGHTDLMWVGFSYLLFATAFCYVRDTELSLAWLCLRSVPLELCLWLTNEEYFVTTQMMLFWGLILLFLFTWAGKSPGKRLQRAFNGYAWTIGLSLALLAPLIIWQLRAPDQPIQSFGHINIYQINLANFVLPVHTRFFGSHDRFTGNVMEQDGYLGLIYLAGLAIFSSISWRRRRTQKWGLTLGTLFLCLMAMGDSLIIQQNLTTPVALPGLILSVLPVLRDVIFDRFMWAAFWGMGLGVVYLYDTLFKPGQRAALILWAALVVASWWPASYPYQALTPNPWISQAMTTGRLGAGDVLLVFPYDTVYDPNNNVLLTQIASHFRYRLAEGYLNPSDPFILHDRMLVSYWSVVNLYGPHSGYARYFLSRVKHPQDALARFLSKTRTDAVVLTPMAHQAFMRQWLTRYLGPPSGVDQGTIFWMDPRVKTR